MVQQPERSKAIAALADLDAVSGSAKFPYLMPDGMRVSTKREAQTWCANRLRRSLRTVQRAFRSFKVQGEKAFQRGSRSDRGTSRFFRSHAKAAVFAAYLHLAHAANCLTIYRAIVASKELLELSSDGVPSYETVRIWLKSSARTELVCSALEGQTLFRSFAADYFQRNSGNTRKGRSRKHDV